MWIQMRETGGMTSCRIDDLSKLIKIEDLRKLLADKFDTPVTRQRLFYRGKQLEDGHTLFDYDVGLNDNVQMMIEADDAEVLKSTSPTKQSHNSPADKNEENKVKVQCLSVDKSRAEHSMVETRKELAKKGEEAASLAVDLLRMLNKMRDIHFEIQMLEAEVVDLGHSLLASMRELRERESQQRQLARAQTLFFREWLKCKDLEEELQRPRNVRRWKSLMESEYQVKDLTLKCDQVQMILGKKFYLLDKKKFELINKSVAMLLMLTEREDELGDIEEPTRMYLVERVGELIDKGNALKELQRKMQCESKAQKRRCQKTEDYRSEIKPMNVLKLIDEVGGRGIACKELSQRSLDMIETWNYLQLSALSQCNF